MKGDTEMKKKLFSLLSTCALLILFSVACSLANYIPGNQGSGSQVTDDQVTTVDEPGQPTTINFKEELKLNIPPNIVPAGSQVTIANVKGAPEFKFPGLKPLGTYDIKMGDGSGFSQPVQIQIQYDPAKLRDDLPAADQLVAAYLDETTNAWMEVDYSVDEASHTVSILTAHLSVWSLFGLEDDSIVSTAPHFRIYFNDKLNAPLFGKPSGAGPIYDFVAQVRAALVDAYDAYAKAPGSYGGIGFRQPDMTNVYLYEWKDPSDAAEWGWYSKNIRIPNSYSDLATLRQDVAHELFHSIQNQYTNVVSMHSNRWFMEGSADYAAATIGTTNGLQNTLGLDFIKKPLNDPDEKHMYRFSHFLQYMDQHDLPFKDLSEAILSTGGDALAGMEGFAKAKGTDLQEIYADFASTFVFGNSLKREPLPTGSPMDLADAKDSFQKSATRLSTTLDIPGNYTTRLVGYEITDDASVAPYKAYLSLLDESSLVKARYVIDKEGEMTGGPLDSSKPVEVELQGGMKVYFLVTNGNENQGTVTVALEQNPTILSTSYSNSFNALIYNQDFTGSVSFMISSTAPFEIVREMVAPNQETFVLDLRIPDLKNGAEIYVEGAVSSIGNKNQESNLTPNIVERYWYVTEVGEIMGGSAAASLPPNSTQGVSMNFNILIDCTNNSIKNSSAVRCGSGTVVIIRIGP